MNINKKLCSLKIINGKKKIVSYGKSIDYPSVKSYLDNGQDNSFMNYRKTKQLYYGGKLKKCLKK